MNMFHRNAHGVPGKNANVAKEPIMIKPFNAYLINENPIKANKKTSETD